jgi:hypothetical protein
LDWEKIKKERLQRFPKAPKTALKILKKLVEGKGALSQRLPRLGLSNGWPCTHMRKHLLIWFAGFQSQHIGELYVTKPGFLGDGG